MNWNINNVNVEDYEIYSNEELEQQIIDCRNASEKLRSDKWKYLAQDENEFILTTKEKIVESITKEIHNYELEEERLQLVLEARYN